MFHLNFVSRILGVESVSSNFSNTKKINVLTFVPHILECEFSLFKFSQPEMLFVEFLRLEFLILNMSTQIKGENRLFKI